MPQETSRSGIGTASQGESPPKRRCIRHLYVPSQADDLREQQQLNEEARLEQALRAKAQKLADACTRPGGSGYPLIKTVPLERPEQGPIEEDEPLADDAKTINERLAKLRARPSTRKAFDKLDKEKLGASHWYWYFGEPPAGSTPSHQTLRDIRTWRTVTARTRWVKPVATEEDGEAQRKRLQTTLFVTLDKSPLQLYVKQSQRTILEEPKSMVRLRRKS